MSARPDAPFAGWEAGDPAAPPALGAADVHVWGARLDDDAASAERVAAARPLLDAVERARADRFAFEHLRRRWTIARAALRRAVAGYAGVAPAELRFAEGEHGKPALAPGSPGAGRLDFNLSHTADAALVAVTRGAPVGVDVERIRGDISREALTHRWFSPAEVAAMEAVPEARRREAFFRCWTAKEAWLKARGEGVQGGLKKFDVAFAPGEPVSLLATRPDPAEAARWTLRSVEVGPEHAAAAAVRAEGARVVRLALDRGPAAGDSGCG